MKQYSSSRFRCRTHDWYARFGLIGRSWASAMRISHYRPTIRTPPRCKCIACSTRSESCSLWDPVRQSKRLPAAQSLTALGEGLML